MSTAGDCNKLSAATIFRSVYSIRPGDRRWRSVGKCVEKENEVGLTRRLSWNGFIVKFLAAFTLSVRSGEDCLKLSKMCAAGDCLKIV